MEIEYDPDRDEFVIVIPDKIINALDLDDGDMLEYVIEDEILKLFKI